MKKQTTIISCAFLICLILTCATKPVYAYGEDCIDCTKCSAKWDRNPGGKIVVVNVKNNCSNKTLVTITFDTVDHKPYGVNKTLRPGETAEVDSCITDTGLQSACTGKYWYSCQVLDELGGSTPAEKGTRQKAPSSSTGQRYSSNQEWRKYLGDWLADYSVEHFYVNKHGCKVTFKGEPTRAHIVETGNPAKPIRLTIESTSGYYYCNGEQNAGANVNGSSKDYSWVDGHGELVEEVGEDYPAIQTLRIISPNKLIWQNETGLKKYNISMKYELTRPSRVPSY